MGLVHLLTNENVGGVDLALRAAGGAIAVIALAMDIVDGPLEWFVAFIAFVGLWSSITRHCTPYELIGFSTKR
ncbi:MAG: DUF2892 domain-containing protein [Candidatus Altiarchaeales archaeon]|nr:DUF2892 domain-containing protein [Candidatus Altiarchaeales archaeon]MBD3416996.1 DUF2892 domain-containing protein [Candidatus Altiarchaeales archaeon]